MRTSLCLEPRSTEHEWKFRSNRGGCGVYIEGGRGVGGFGSELPVDKEIELDNRTAVVLFGQTGDPCALF